MTRNRPPRVVHDGMSCRQVERVLDLRTRQVLDLREQVKRLTADVQQLRTEVAEHRKLTASFIEPLPSGLDAFQAGLAFIARAEAVARGDQAAADSLAPSTAGEAAAQHGTATLVVAELTRQIPDLADEVRRTLLERMANHRDEHDTQGANDDDR